MELIHGKHKLPLVLQPHTCIISSFGENHKQLRPKSPARIVLPDRVPLHSHNCHVIGLHLRLSTPAARAAEWLHYISDGPDERLNGKSVYRSLRLSLVRLGPWTTNVQQQSEP